MNFIAHFGLGVLERLSLRFENKNWGCVGTLDIQALKKFTYFFVINSWDSLSSNLYGVNTLDFKWISNQLMSAS